MLNETIIFAVELLIILLAIAVVVGVLARKLRLPYTVGLVLVGVIILVASNWFRTVEEFLPLVGQWLHILEEALHFNDQVVRTIIMGLLVPPLIFEAAFHLNFSDLQRNLRPILLFAIPGVLITTFLVGWVVTWGTGLTLSTAIVFGALIAATDPVAVVALFRSLGVPKRLAILLEGESLLNDGTAIVVFGIAVAVSNGAEFSIGNGIFQFLLISGGGLFIGTLAGLIVFRLITRIDDHLIETALTFILAFGTYTVAETLHVSGVLSVVAAGLMAGNLGSRGMSPTTKFVVGNFWEFTAFVANSIVFLLIGMVVEINLVFSNILPILFAIGAVLLARAIVIFGFSLITRDIPLKWQAVLHWGGLRGAISLALVLSIGGQPELRAMAFGVVLFTLLVQSLTMGPLVKRLKLGDRHIERDLYDRVRARAIAAQAAISQIERRHSSGMISDKTWKTVYEVLSKEVKALKDRMHSLLDNNPDVAAEELDHVWRESLKIQRKELIDLYEDGFLSEDLLKVLVTRIDSAFQSDDLVWKDREEMNRELLFPGDEE